MGSRLLRRSGGRSVRRRRRRPSGHAAAVPRWRRRRGVLQQEPATRRARVCPHGGVHLPLRAAPPAAGDRRGGDGGVGRSDEHGHLPSVAGTHREHRQPRRAAHRSRPAAGYRVRRGAGRRPRAARADGRARSDGLGQDQRQPRAARLCAHRADPRVHRRPARRHRDRARAGATAPGPGDDRVVEGGTGRADLRRLQPGQPGPDDRLGLLAAAAGGRPGVDAGALGGPRRCRDRRLHRSHRAGARRGRTATPGPG